jgi:hypothetical protein
MLIGTGLKSNAGKRISKFFVEKKIFYSLVFLLVRIRLTILAVLPENK